MSSSIIAANASAGNAAYATVYTAPAGSEAIIGNITAYNTTGGALTCTIGVTEADGSTSVLAVASINTLVTQSFSGHSSYCVTPLTLAAGTILKAQGSATGITVRASGISFT